MKKRIFTILLTGILLLQTLSAQAQSGLFGKVFSLESGTEMSFAAGATLKKLYPYTDDQAALYGRALSNVLLRYLASDREDKTFIGIDLEYAGEHLFSQVEFALDGEFYSLNSLLDKRLIKSSHSNALVENTVNPFDYTLLFDMDQAREDLALLIENTGALAELKKGNISIKGFPKANFAATLKLTKDTVAAHEELITDALMAGFSHEYRSGLFIEPFGNWEIKQFFNQSEELVGLRMNGSANVNDIKNTVEYVLNFTKDFSVFEITCMLKQNRNNYRSLKLKYDKDGLVHRSELEEAEKKNIFRQTVESDLKLEESATINRLRGTYTLSEEQTEDGSSKSIRLTPNIQITKDGIRRSVEGEMGLLMSENNVTMVDADIRFQANDDTKKLEQFAHALDTANRHGGIENNLDYIQTVVKYFYEEETQKTILLDLDRYSDMLLEGIRMEIIDNFSAKLLHAMLKQEDHSAYILSFGMQPADWDEFIQEYKRNQEE